jgi:hypothetical protein
MTDWVVPSSWAQLRSWDQLERWRASRAGLIVILDDPTVSHVHDPWCGDVAEANFETTKRNGSRTGAYYWITDVGQAAGYASSCGNCGGTPAPPGGV